MSHFENIRLKEHKGIKGALLTNLGRINVLSGPNSSGKTTALECLIDNQRHARGRKFFAQDLTKLQQVPSTNGRTWTNQIYAAYYTTALNEALSEKDVVFQDELDSIWATINESFLRQARSGGNLQFHADFAQAFQRLFEGSPTVVLIPAKRRLDSASPMNASEPIEHTGNGVLNYLFRAKNKENSSELRKKFDEIKAGFFQITGGCDFDVLLRDNNQVELKLCNAGGVWLFADDCGLGFRDLLIMLYFGLAAKEDVILIEEPENHLHPEIQRALVRFLRAKSSKQFFLTTHSSVFLSTEFADRVFSCRLKDSVIIQNATSKAALLTELGYSISDNLVSDLIILCEGPKDKPALEEFLSKRGLLEKFRIKIWPLGGDIMAQLDLSVFEERNRVLALIDSDPGSDKVRKSFVAKCKESGILVQQLQRYALENYFTISAIEKVTSQKVPSGIAQLDPNKKVSAQIGFEVKNNGRKIAKEMTLQDIQATDLNAFLDTAEKILKGSS